MARPTGTAERTRTGSNQYFTSADGSDFFAQPAQFTIGTAPRTLGKVRDPGANNADLSMFKEFGLGKVRDGMRLEFRFETFNAFNHPQFCGPGHNVWRSELRPDLITPVTVRVRCKWH